MLRTHQRKQDIQFYKNNQQFRTNVNFKFRNKENQIRDDPIKEVERQNNLLKFRKSDSFKDSSFYQKMKKSSLQNIENIDRPNW